MNLIWLPKSRIDNYEVTTYDESNAWFVTPFCDFYQKHYAVKRCKVSTDVLPSLSNLINRIMSISTAVRFQPTTWLDSIGIISKGP